MSTNRNRTPIFDVIEAKDFESLEEYLKNPNEKEELYKVYNNYPIRYAVKSLFWQGVILLAKHEKCNPKNKDDYVKVLIEAIKHNQIEAVQSLLEADTPLAVFKDNRWKTYNIDDNFFTSKTIFSYVIEKCPGSAMFKMLLSYLPERVTEKTSFFQDVISEACASDKLDIAEMIFSRPDYTLQTKDYLKYINTVINNKGSSSSQLEMVKDLTQKIKKLDGNPLKIIALLWDELKINKATISYLFDQGFNLTQYDNHEASPIETAVRFRRKDCAKLLIEVDNEKNPIFNQKRIEAIHYDGALLLAIEKNQGEIAKLLLNHHAKLDLNKVPEVLKKTEKIDDDISNLLLAHDINLLLIKGKSSNNVFSESPETLDVLQKTEAFITSHLREKNSDEYELTTTLQCYHHIKTLYFSLKEGSIEFKHTPQAIEYLKLSFLNLFNVHKQKLEQLSRKLNNLSGKNYQETITQTNLPNTEGGQLSKLKTVLNDLIGGLDPGNKFIVREEKVILNDFADLSSKNWQKFPEAKLILDHMEEYLYQIKPITQSYIDKVKNYLKKLRTSIEENDKKQNWEYKIKIFNTTINKRPGHIENTILPLLNKLDKNYLMPDRKVLEIFVAVKNTFANLLEHPKDDRAPSTKKFAEDELGLIQKISYKNEADQLVQRTAGQTENPPIQYSTNNYLANNSFANNSSTHQPQLVHPVLYPNAYNPLYTYDVQQSTHPYGGGYWLQPQTLTQQAGSTPQLSAQQLSAQQTESTQVPQYFYLIPVQPSAPLFTTAAQYNAYTGTGYAGQIIPGSAETQQNNDQPLTQPYSPNIFYVPQLVQTQQNENHEMPKDPPPAYGKSEKGDTNLRLFEKPNTNPFYSERDNARGSSSSFTDFSIFNQSDAATRSDSKQKCNVTTETNSNNNNSNNNVVPLTPVYISSNNVSKRK